MFGCLVTTQQIRQTLETMAQFHLVLSLEGCVLSSIHSLSLEDFHDEVRLCPNPGVKVIFGAGKICAFSSVINFWTGVSANMLGLMEGKIVLESFLYLCTHLSGHCLPSYYITKGVGGGAVKRPRASGVTTPYLF